MSAFSTDGALLSKSSFRLVPWWLGVTVSKALKRSPISEPFGPGAKVCYGYAMRFGGGGARASE